MAGRAGTRRGMTLVEILLATFILASVLLPIGGLIFGGARRSESTKSFNVGANIAANIMDQLMSSEVPFTAIDVQGGPTIGEIMAAAKLDAGLDGAISGSDAIKTAGFAASYSGLEDKIFGALGKPVDGNTRVIYDKGFIYEIYWFAGIYKDEVSGSPAYDQELTFGFFKNPYVPVDNSVATSIVLPSGHDELNPYKREPEAVSDPVLGNIDNPKDPRARPGWPKVGDFATEPTYEQVRSKVSGGQVNLDYPLVFTDQEEFNEPDGGLMKLIVGVRWGTKASIRKKTGLGTQRRTHEFWLVSMKGRIEEG